MEKNEEIRKMNEACGVHEGDKAFRPAMPTGKCTLVKFPTLQDAKVYGSSTWYPVSFKSAENGEIYELSLKGLEQAPGLKYKTLDLDERALALSNMVNKQFEYLGKKPKECRLKQDKEITWRDEEGDEHVAHKGDKFLMWQHTFAEKVVG